MLLPLWLFHWIFLSWWTLVLFPSTKKSTRKSWILICSLASNFWPVTNIRKTWTWEFFVVWILEIWTWNLRGYISHVVAKKSLSIAPGGEMKNEEAELSFVTPSRKQKEVTEKSKEKRSSNQIKRVKENAWMLKLGEVC